MVYGSGREIIFMNNDIGSYKFWERWTFLLHWYIVGRDCLCLMPTGGGKSMCYQIPALAKKAGIVLVVCPLIGDY